MAATSTATRLTAESKTFVSFVSKYFGAKWVKSLNARQDNGRVSCILGEVVRLAHNGDYAEVGRSYEMAAYGIGWAYDTMRINGMTCMAIRQMDVKSILTLVGQVRDLGLNTNEVASYLMSLNLQPAN